MSSSKLNFCLFLPNWIGDVIMSTPSLRLLKEYFGEDATFTAVGRPFIPELLEGSDRFDSFIPFQPRSSDPALHQRRIVRTLRQSKFDAGILFPNSIRIALAAWFARIPCRIGYAPQGRRLLLTHPLAKPSGIVPQVDYYLALADQLVEFTTAKKGYVGKHPMDCSEIEKRRLELRTSENEERLGDLIWNNLGLRPPDKVVMLHVGSASSVVRYWSTDYAARLSQTIVDRLGMDVLINCGPGEIDTAREIVGRSERDRVFSLADQPMNIHAGKICLKRSRIVISTDSGPIHIATAFGRPTIVLRGPTDDIYISNPAADMHILSANLYCSPCHGKLRCSEKHHRCMLELTPELVFEELLRVLQRPEE